MHLVNSLSNSTKKFQPDSVCAFDVQSQTKAEQIAARLGITVGSVTETQPQIYVTDNRLSLSIPDLGKPITIQFEAGKYDHRRKFGGGTGQPLAKAIGIKKGQTPSVIDATAGFARDAFVIATLGCPVRLLERNSVLSVLIEDALIHAAEHPEITDIATRMQLINTDAITYLEQLDDNDLPDVIYMDPMYPSRDKSALVKKEMQLLHQMIGPDTDSTDLLQIAQTRAKKRVVVKRPKGAEYVGRQKPSVSIESKNTRYDVYVTM